MSPEHIPKPQDSPSTPDLVEERRAFLRKVGKAALAGGAVSTLIVAGTSLPTRAASAYGGNPFGGPPKGNPFSSPPKGPPFK
jgi:hypothetical protein